MTNYQLGVGGRPGVGASPKKAPLSQHAKKPPFRNTPKSPPFAKGGLGGFYTYIYTYTSPGTTANPMLLR